MDLNNIRTEYKREDLNINDLCSKPTEQLEKWIKDASKISDYFNAATLSTVDSDNIPSSRIVLAKNIQNDSLIFYTNYDSDKGRDIEINPNVSLLFFWPEQDRQIRLQGRAQKTSRKDSINYFSSRPKESQISAIASAQSKITTKEKLHKDFENVKKEDNVQCPIFWGGYKVVITKYEFWQGRPNRLHDRFTYTQETDSTWKIDRLCP